MKKLFSEFKEFVNRGNVMDLAVAVVMGAAFTAIINSVVGDLVTPLISLLTFGINFSTFSLSFGEGATAAVFKYGAFLQAVLNFLVVAIVIFFMVKGLNKLARKKSPAEDTPMKECPYCHSQIQETAARCPNCTTILDASKVPENVR